MDLLGLGKRVFQAEGKSKYTASEMGMKKSARK